jgi:hypothetical protein
MDASATCLRQPCQYEECSVLFVLLLFASDLGFAIKARAFVP